MTIYVSSSSTITPWTTFYPYVASELPAVPFPVLDHCLRRAAIEFCEETGVHLINPAPISVVANTAEYALDTGDSELDLSIIKFAWLDGFQLPYVAQDTLNAGIQRNWQTDEAPRPSAFTQQDQENIILYPIPTEAYADGLVLKFVVRPSLSSTGVYTWVATRFIQEISFGALAILAGMVGKPWSNPDAARRYMAAFEAAKTRATIDANRSFTRAPLQISKSRNW